MRRLNRGLCLGLALLAFAAGLALGLTLPRPPPPPPPFPSVSFVNLSTPGGLVQGVYWGRAVEHQLPRGYSDREAADWERFVADTPVSAVSEGCGRMQNRLVTFEGGVRACARYRQNTDQIQGELFSFYLGRELGLVNLAPSAPATVEPESAAWSAAAAGLAGAGWAKARPLVLTRFLDGLEAAPIPAPLRNASRRLHPPDAAGLSPKAALELAQWSDLIVFDYLTANLDRVVNNLYNLQWNPGMMEAPAHNLARHRQSRLLVFLDNESGLLHGYRLLDKYESYHSVLLDALCVFRRSTVEAVRRLRSLGDLGAVLGRRLSKLSREEVVPGLPDKSVRILRDRLGRVLDQVSWCSRHYSDSSPDR